MAPPPESPAAALQALPVVQAMHHVPWLYPALATVHLVGVAVLAGGVFLFDLRLLGVNRTVPVRHLARHLLPLAVAALVLIVPTGLLMFMAHALTLLASGIFLLKMVLIFGAGFHAVFFHMGPYRGADAWNVDAPTPAVVKLSAVVSMLTWIAVIACGRLIVHA